MATDELPTAEECLEEIKDLNARIRKLSQRPASTSAKGVFVSNQGMIANLQKERNYWREQYRQAKARENAGGESVNGVQGPDFNLQ